MLKSFASNVAAVSLALLIAVGFLVVGLMSGIVAFTLMRNFIG
jgi:hypothetical protein